MANIIIQAALTNSQPTFSITDETGKPLYKVVNAPAIPTRKKCCVEDTSGKRIGTINRRRYSFGYVDLPRWYVETAGWNEVSIIKDMTQFQTSYQVKGEGLAIDGAFLGDSFELRKGGEKLAKVTVTEADGFRFAIELHQPTVERLIVTFLIALALVYLNEKAQVSV